MERRTLEFNKRSDFTGVLFLIVSIVAFGFFILVLGYVTPLISEKISDEINSSDYRINEAFGTSTSVSQNGLSNVWLILFAGLVIGLFITSWLIPTEPIFIPIFIILLVITVVVGHILSQAYLEFYSLSVFEDTAATQTIPAFILVNLPYIGLIVGLTSLVISFAKPKGGTIA